MVAGKSYRLRAYLCCLCRQALNIPQLCQVSNNTGCLVKLYVGAILVVDILETLDRFQIKCGAALVFHCQGAVKVQLSLLAPGIDVQ